MEKMTKKYKYWGFKYKYKYWEIVLEYKYQVPHL